LLRFYIVLETKGRVLREWRRHPRGMDASSLGCVVPIRQFEKKREEE
jgi:hypothetical protein